MVGKHCDLKKPFSSAISAVLANHYLLRNSQQDSCIWSTFERRLSDVTG